MKKIFYIFLLASGLVSVSCVNEIERVFDESSSERLKKSMQECAELLTSPEHGWLIHYYPSTDRSYGGCTYAARFDEDGNVYVTSDVVAYRKKMTFGEEKKSHYSIKGSSSVVLSFDTYNLYLHYWSDPDVPMGNKKYGGDIEYAYIEGNEEMMVFRGTKSGNTIVFTPLEESIGETMKKIEPIYLYTTPGNHTEKKDFFSGFKCVIGGKEVRLDKTRDFNRFTCGNVDMPYVITPDGINLYETVEINGVRVRDMKWDGGKLVLMDEASGSAVSTLEGFLNDRWMPYEAFLGKYTFPCMTDWIQKKWDEDDEALEQHVFNVRLMEDEDMGCTRETNKLLMRGMSWPRNTNYGIDYPETPFDVILDFDPFDGTLTLSFQQVGISGDSDQWDVFIMAADPVSGGYYPYKSVGIKIRHNNDPDNLRLDFDVVKDASGANCLLVGRYYNVPETIIQSSSWRGYINYIKELTSMTKINE